MENEFLEEEDKTEPQLKEFFKDLEDGDWSLEQDGIETLTDNKKLKKYMNYKKRYYKKKYGEEATIPEIPPLPQKGATLEEMTDFCNKLIELGFKPVFPRGKIVPLKPPE